MTKKPQVCAIVPAYNEEETIGNVVSVLKKAKILDELYVICDGSTDKTKEVAEKAGATVHQLMKKGGKGQAMLHGVAHTDAPVIVFFDADLKGLTPEHVEKLVSPVINGEKVMNVAIRDRGPIMSKIARHLPLIGGERAMLRGVIENINPEFLKGFMVESALNYYCRLNGLKYGTDFMPGLSMRRKYEKVGWHVGLIQYFKMTFEVIKAMIWVRIAAKLKKFP